MEYVMFFNVDNVNYKLPTNPSELNISEGQEIKEFDILRLGKIAVPSSMELKKYSFEVELPSKVYNYVLTKDDFKPAKFYIDLISKWRKEKKVIRFVASNAVNDISELVVIENMDIVEKAGEEGDYYADISLVQYKPYEVKEGVVEIKTFRKDNKSIVAQKAPKAPPRPSTPPKPQAQTYVIVQGDTLWGIAKRFLGDGSRYPEIHKINQPPLSKNPNLIYPGQKIKIPLA